MISSGESHREIRSFRSFFYSIEKRPPFIRNAVLKSAAYVYEFCKLKCTVSCVISERNQISLPSRGTKNVKINFTLRNVLKIRAAGLARTCRTCACATGDVPTVCPKRSVRHT